MSSCKEITSLEFLVLMGEYMSLENRDAFNKFRSEYALNILDDPQNTREHNATARQARFNTLLDRYRKFPAQRILDMRMEKTSAFKKELAEAFLCCSSVSELEVEDWMREMAAVKQYEKGIVSALEMLETKLPDQAIYLAEKAKVLWPHWYKADEDTSEEVASE